jgi:hypothetical protein
MLIQLHDTLFFFFILERERSCLFRLTADKPGPVFSTSTPGVVTSG